MKNFIQKFAAKCEYPDIRIWANPLICSKIAKYPISESIIIYPIGVANARNIQKYPLGYRRGPYIQLCTVHSVHTAVRRVLYLVRVYVRVVRVYVLN